MCLIGGEGLESLPVWSGVASEASRDCVLDASGVTKVSG